MKNRLKKAAAVLLMCTSLLCVPALALTKNNIKLDFNQNYSITAELNSYAKNAMEESVISTATLSIDDANLTPAPAELTINRDGITQRVEMTGYIDKVQASPYSGYV